MLEKWKNTGMHKYYCGKIVDLSIFKEIFIQNKRMNDFGIAGTDKHLLK